MPTMPTTRDRRIVPSRYGEENEERWRNPDELLRERGVLPPLREPEPSPVTWYPERRERVVEGWMSPDDLLQERGILPPVRTPEYEPIDIAPTAAIAPEREVVPTHPAITTKVPKLDLDDTTEPDERQRRVLGPWPAIAGSLAASVVDFFPGLARGFHQFVGDVFTAVAGEENAQQIAQIYLDTPGLGHYIRGVDAALKAPGRLREEASARALQAGFEEHGLWGAGAAILSDAVVNTIMLVKTMGALKIGYGATKKGWKGALKTAPLRAMLMAVTREGLSLEDRAGAFALGTAYMATPALSGTIGKWARSDWIAKGTDIAANFAITTSRWNTMVEQSHARAEAEGQPELGGFYLLMDAIQSYGADVVYGAFTQAFRDMPKVAGQMDEARKAGGVEKLKPEQIQARRVQQETARVETARAEDEQARAWEAQKQDATRPYEAELERAQREGRRGDVEDYAGAIEAINKAQNPSKLAETTGLLRDAWGDIQAEKVQAVAEPERAVAAGAGSRADDALKETIENIGRTGDDTAQQARMAGIEREGEEVRGAIPERGTGAEEIAASRVLQAQREAEAQRLAEREGRIAEARGPFEYQLQYRPATLGSVPDGYIGTRDDGSRFGVVQYDRPLTQAEQQRFELKPLDPQDPANLKAAHKAASDKVDVESEYGDKAFSIETPTGAHLYSPDVRRGGDAWRVTFMDKEGQPTGHMEYGEYREARDAAASERMRQVAPPAEPRAEVGAPDVLYHGTTQGALRKIVADGIKPTTMGQVSLSDTEQYAQTYADRKGGARGIVLRVRGVKTAPDARIPEGGDFLSRESIPPENIEVKMPDGAWAPLKAVDVSVGTPKIKQGYTREGDRYVFKGVPRPKAKPPKKPKREIVPRMGIVREPLDPTEREKADYILGITQESRDRVRSGEPFGATPIMPDGPLGPIAGWTSAGRIYPKGWDGKQAQRLESALKRLDEGRPLTKAQNEIIDKAIEDGERVAFEREGVVIGDDFESARQYGERNPIQVNESELSEGELVFKYSRWYMTRRGTQPGVAKELVDGDTIRLGDFDSVDAAMVVSRDNPNYERALAEYQAQEREIMESRRRAMYPGERAVQPGLIPERMLPFNLAGERIPDEVRIAEEQRATEARRREGLAALERAQMELPGIEPVRTDEVSVTRPRDPAAPRPEGIAKPEAQKQVDQLAAKWKNKPKGGIQVVDRAEVDGMDLSDRSKQSVRDSNPEAFYDIKNDRVVIIADNLARPEDVTRVALHETIGHKGVRAVLGDKLDTELLRLGEGIDRAELEAIAREYGVSLETREGRLVAIEEHIARNAEAQPTRWQSFVATVRRLLEELGISKETIDSWFRTGEIDRLIEESRLAIARGTPAEAARADDVRLSLAGREEELFRLEPTKPPVMPPPKPTPPAERPVSAITGFTKRGQLYRAVAETAKTKGVDDVRLQDISKTITGHKDFRNRENTVSDILKVMSELRKDRPAPKPEGKRSPGRDPVSLETELSLERAIDHRKKAGLLTDEIYNEMRQKHLDQVLARIPEEMRADKQRAWERQPHFESKRVYATEREARNLIKDIAMSERTIKQRIEIEQGKARNPEVAAEIDRVQAIDKRELDRRRAQGKNDGDGVLTKVSQFLDTRHYFGRISRFLAEPEANNIEYRVADARFFSDHEIDRVNQRVIAGIKQADWNRIARSPEALKRMETYIASVDKDGIAREIPKGLTKDERIAADRMIEVWKEFQPDVRWLRFMEWVENPKIDIPDAPRADLEEARRLLYEESHDAARKYLDGKTWGVIEEGYMPVDFIGRKDIVPRRVDPHVSEQNLKTRAEAAFRPEQQDRDVFQKFSSYVRRMTHLKHLQPEIDAWEAWWRMNEHRFNANDRKAIFNDFQSHAKELLGIREPPGPLEKYVMRAYSQAAVVIFNEPTKGVRNLFQPAVMHTGISDLLRAKKLSPERRQWFETYVNQNRGIVRDLMFGDMPAVPGFTGLNRILQAVNVMGRTDTINRLVDSMGTFSRVDRAMAKYPNYMKDRTELNKMLTAAGIGDLTAAEGLYARQLLVTKGEEPFARFMAQAVTQKNQFVYNRWQRSPAEQGTDFRRIMSNLFVFPKSYAQRWMHDIKKITSKVERDIGKPTYTPRRAGHSIVGVVAMGMVANALFEVLTGSKRRPYDPHTMVSGMFGVGGLATGAQLRIASFATNVAMSFGRGEEAEKALGRAINDATTCADMFIPFYRMVMQAYEGFGGYSSVDRAALRQVRTALDERYEGRPMGYYERERDLIETGQHILFGTRDAMPEPKPEYKARKMKTPAEQQREYLRAQRARQQKAQRRFLPPARD